VRLPAAGCHGRSIGASARARLEERLDARQVGPLQMVRRACRDRK